MRSGQIRYRRLKRFPQKGGFCEGLESNGEGRGPRDFQSRTGPDCRPSANVGAGFSAIGEGFASRRRAGSHLRRWGDRMTIREAAQLLRERSVSAVELTTSAIGRIERRNPKLNAFITITADQALERARQADRELAAGQDRGPLHGIPIALKDLFATRGIRTTAGGKQ